MKFWITYPIASGPYAAEFLTGGAVQRFAQAAEVAGFDAIAFTDHPAPSEKWLRAGGHDAFDPFAALSFVAGATTSLRLIPNIVVLPYRNPLLVAKLAASLDALSGGRFVLSTALGYLRSEYRALGVDFDRRNELFDEALLAIKGVWANDSFAFEGSDFAAVAVSANPKPARIPIWIGGNSQRSRRRVAEHADGWNPFPASAELAATTGTARLETAADLAGMLAYLWEQVDAAGRDRADIDVTFTSPHGRVGTAGFDADAHAEALAQFAALGVTYNGVTVPGDSLAAALDGLAEYGERVIRPQR